MNDPGFEIAVAQASNDVESKPHRASQNTEEEEEEDFLDPSRFWLLSTACPLIAGTFGPMANAFSICALGESWRVKMEPGQSESQGKSVPDPAWLLTINAISLFLAIVANIALLLNMARRLSFAIAQPITIIGWFIASFLLIALTGAASSEIFRIEPRSEHALSQAFYYAIIAAALYFIIAMLMVATVLGAVKGHYKKEFRLTTSQRTLMLQTIAFMGYLLLGALVYKYIEGWEYLDAVYFSCFSLLTVGIGGNFVPMTHLGRGLLFPFAIAGIVTIGLVVGSIRSLVLERGARKMHARFIEKARESTIRSFNPDKHTIKFGWFKRHEVSRAGLTEAQRREQEFNIMREVQSSANHRRRWISLVSSVVATAILWFVGAAVFWVGQRKSGWTYFTSVYFAFTSLLTIGYGDFEPDANSTKPFFVFWALLAVPTLTILISNAGNTLIKGFADLTLRLGSLTTLESSFGRLVRRNKQPRPNDFGFDEPPGFLPKSSDEEQDNSMQVVDHALERLTKHLEADELQEARLADRHGDEQGRHVHLYRYILSRELRHLMRDMTVKPPKEYAYREWTWYLRLLGQDEANPSFHQQPLPYDSKHRPPNWGINTDDFDCANTRWSWLGVRSPLMSNKTETEWLVIRIGGALQRTLARPFKEADAPVSFADLLKMYKEGQRKASGSDGGDERSEEESAGLREADPDRVEAKKDR